MINEGFYEKGKFADEQHKIEMEIKNAETIEIFKGSGIIENLEKIRDSQILVFANINGTRQVDRMFGKNDIPLEQTIPAKIIYGLNKVSLIYDADILKSKKDLPDEFVFCEIIVKKIDDTNFEYSGIGETKIGDAKETRNNISNFVKNHEPYHADYVKKPDNKALIGYSKDIDEKYSV